MGGSHRGESTGRSKVWIPLVLVAVLLVIGGGVAIAAFSGSGSSDPQANDRPSPTGSSSGSPTTAASQTPTAPPPSEPASPEPSRPPPPRVLGADLPKISTSSPRRLTIGSLIDTGFDVAITGQTDRLIPPSRSEVARWADRGRPGNPTDDTVVIVGAANISGSGSFSDLGEVEKGDSVEVSTDYGTLTYRVTTVGRIRAAQQLRNDTLTRKQPGRLVLIGARYDSSGDRLTEDLFVVAELSDVG